MLLLKASEGTRILMHNNLLREGIEPNPGLGPGPGPGPGVREESVKSAKINLKIRTFNCNGLGNNSKLRRVFSKA